MSTDHADNAAIAYRPPTIPDQLQYYQSTMCAPRVLTNL